MTGRRSPLPILVPTLACLALVAGCGGGTYEKRLEATGRWYGHLAELDQHLVSTAWKDGNVAYLRPPKGFVAQFEKEPSDKPVPSAPAFLDGPIDGLQAVFTDELRVKVEGDTAGSAKATAYLLVFDNHAMWVSPKETVRNKASKYKAILGSALARQFGLNTTNIERWDELRLPRVGGYGKGRTLHFMHVEELAGPIDGRTYELKAYAYVMGEVQAVAVYLIPTNALNEKRLDTAIDLSIDTFELIDKTPAYVDPSKLPVDGGGSVGGF